MGERREWRYLVAILALSDLFCLTAAVGLSALLLGRAVGVISPADGLIFAGLAGLFLVVLAGHGAYDPQALLGGAQEYAAVFRSCIYGLAAAGLIVLALGRTVSVGWVLLSWVLATLFLEVARFGIRRLACRLRAAGYFVRRVVVVGADASSLAITSQLASKRSGMQVVGMLDDYVPAGSVLPGGIKVLGPSRELAGIASRAGAHDAILMTHALPWESLQRLLREVTTSANGLRVHLSAGFHDLLTTGVRLVERDHVTLLAVNQARLNATESLVKGALDYALATVLLVAFTPALILTVVWQRLLGTYQGLERRRVLGLHGKPFELLSLRSPAPFNSDLIRKLPGLINILRGELSLVGPQPVLADDRPAESRMPGLLTLRPGLTGPWRQARDAETQAVLDLYYIRSYSIWLDLQVLLSRFWYRVGGAVSEERSRGYPRLKRALDMIGAALLLLVTSPVLLGCLLAVWVDTGKPLIYRRRVVGRGGRPFDAFKLRTMVRDAERILAEDPALLEAFRASNKLKDDPRVTRVGRWLRRMSLDELPQLINVLRGEMSLVGPRMITPQELPEWGETASLLLAVRPGLTGLWQISGRQRLTKADRIRMDAEYVRSLSLVQDLSILLRTIPAVLSGRGAY